MIENLGESLDAVLEPVLMRAVTRRGRSLVMKLGDKEVEYDPSFKLFLQTKLSNPHYKPEIAAQTTLINFMITVDGLQEQLLALVVNKVCMYAHVFCIRILLVHVNMYTHFKRI